MRDKDNKKSLGSSVASDIRDDDNTTRETMPESISKSKEKGER